MRIYATPGDMSFLGVLFLLARLAILEHRLSGSETAMDPSAMFNLVPNKDRELQALDESLPRTTFPTELLNLWRETLRTIYPYDR